MFKLIFIIVGAYLIAQFALGIDVNKKLEPMLEPLIEMVSEKTNETLPELGQKLFDNLSKQDLTNLIESSDFNLDDVTSMLDKNDVNLEGLSDLLESQNLDSESAKEKLEELKQLVKDKIEAGN